MNRQSPGAESAGTVKRQPPPPLAPADALEILATALAECSRSGLRVTVGSTTARGAVIVLPGVSVEVVDGRAVFTVTPTDPH